MKTILAYTASLAVLPVDVRAVVIIPKVLHGARDEIDSFEGGEMAMRRRSPRRSQPLVEASRRLLVVVGDRSKSDWNRTKSTSPERKSNGHPP